VLAAWQWDARPAAVVHVGAYDRPTLAAALASKISAIGWLPDLGGVPHRHQSGAQRSNSAQRLRAVHDAYALPNQLAAQLANGHRGDPILLVDDYTATGWTLTVVARLLRQAGAGAVYPLVLGIAR
jgi:ATP-dependent DNA helicase RecQ